MLNHERNAIGGGSAFAGTARGHGDSGPRASRTTSALVDMARAVGGAGDFETRQLLAEAHVRSTVRGQLSKRVGAGIRTRKFEPTAGSLLKLMTATTSARISTIGMEIAGTAGVVHSSFGPSAPSFANQYLVRQANCIAGGSNEMQRNMSAERVLGMPKERADDRDKPFREVQRNRVPRRSQG